MTSDERFFWCTRHGRVERSGQACPVTSLLGPYDSEADARDWRTRHEAREDRWQEQDDDWKER